MFSEDSGDHTLPPTERHRREARSRGEVARSPQLISAAILFSASCLLWTLTPTSANPLVTLLRNGLTTVSATPLTIESTQEMVYSAIRSAGIMLLPFILVLLISGLFANLIQVGWLWVPDAVSPRFRLSGLALSDQLANATGLILRLVVLASVTLRFISIHDWKFYSLGQSEPSMMIVQFLRMMAELSVQLTVCLMLLAVGDYGYRFWQQEQRLKMSFEQRRREQLEDGIDARVKQKQSASNRRGHLQSTASVSPVGAANE